MSWFRWGYLSITRAPYTKLGHMATKRNMPKRIHGPKSVLFSGHMSQYTLLIYTFDGPTPGKVKNITHKERECIIMKEWPLGQFFENIANSYGYSYIAVVGNFPRMSQKGGRSPKKVLAAASPCDPAIWGLFHFFRHF